MAKMTKVPITERALVQRINRKLAQDDKKIVKNRRGPYAESLGDYYGVDLARNNITGPSIHNHAALEEYGRELGVLREWEVLEDAN